MSVFEIYFTCGGLIGILNALAFMCNGEPKGRGFFIRLFDYLIMLSVMVLVWPIYVYRYFADFWKLYSLNRDMEKLLQKIIEETDTNGKQED